MSFRRTFARLRSRLAGPRPTIARSCPDCSSSLEPFFQSLAETIAWCSSRVTIDAPMSCLRDPLFEPESPHSAQVNAMALMLARRRANFGRVEPAHSLDMGRLVVYFPHADLCDGAAEVESRGFFDVHNCPPWDTWVATFEDTGTDDDAYSVYLIAWVPSELMELADAGIAVNPENCIAWLDQTSVAAWPLIRRAYARRRPTSA